MPYSIFHQLFGFSGDWQLVTVSNVSPGDWRLVAVFNNFPEGWQLEAVFNLKDFKSL